MLNPLLEQARQDSLKKKQLWVVLCLLSLIILASGVTFSHVHTKGTASLGPDEAGWVSAGYIHTELLIHLITEMDLDPHPWQQKDSFFHMNGQLGKWFLGIPVAVYFRLQNDPRALKFPDLTIASFRTLRDSLVEDYKKGEKQAVNVFLLSRAVSASFGVIICLAVFLIGSACRNLWIGWIAAMIRFLVKYGSSNKFG